MRKTIVAAVLTVFVLASSAAASPKFGWDKTNLMRDFHESMGKPDLPVPEVVAGPTLAAVSKPFKHPDCKVMPWGVLTSPQVKKTANYSWADEAGMKAEFKAKGYLPTDGLVSIQNLREGALFTFLVTSCGKESGFFSSQFVCYSIIRINKKDSSAKHMTRTLFEHHPHKSLVQTDKRDMMKAAAASLRVALRGIPTCKVDPSAKR